MLDLKKYNWIRAVKGTGNFAISALLRDVLPFLEMEGYTAITFIPQYNNCSLAHFIDNYKIFKSREHLEELISDKGNFFRVNLIVLDLYFCENIDQVNSYLRMFGEFDCQFIILMGDSVPVNRGDSTYYGVKYVSDIGSNIHNIINLGERRSNVVVTDLWEGWESSLEDLKKAWVRDKKISGFLDESGLGDEADVEDY